MTTAQPSTVADNAAAPEQPHAHHTCPWWLGYFLVNPLRRLREDPDTILGPHVKPGMTAVDIGCAMGFFSLPLARMVGENGRVVCVDIQQRMLDRLEKRARKAGLDRRIESRLASQNDLDLHDLAGRADIVLAVHVVHEAAYPRAFLQQCAELLAPDGKLLVIEPAGHVSRADFAETRRVALELGLTEVEPRPRIKTHALLLAKASG